MSDVDDFREWLWVRRGTACDATDEQLGALLDQAQAKREALGYGSVFVMAEAMLLAAHSADVVESLVDGALKDLRPE